MTIDAFIALVIPVIIGVVIYYQVRASALPKPHRQEVWWRCVDTIWNERYAVESERNSLRREQWKTRLRYWRGK